MNDALREANRNAASNSYFDARPQIDIRDRRNVFEAGFDRGWEAAQNAATQADESSAMLDGRPKDNVPAANSRPAVAAPDASTFKDRTTDLLGQPLYKGDAAPDAQDAELIAELRDPPFPSVLSMRRICDQAAARIEQLERDLDAANAAMRHEREGYECAIASGYAADAQRERAEKAEAALAAANDICKGYKRLYAERNVVAKQRQQLLEKASGQIKWLKKESKRCKETEVENEKLKAALAEAQKDAERYRWLRSQHLTDNTISVVCRPKDALKLGWDCPSEDRLDAAIDAAKGRK